MVVMPLPEDLALDHLQDGERLPFPPYHVGLCHSDFGLIAGYVSFVERLGDVLTAQLSDGRRFEVQGCGTAVNRYALCRLDS